MNNSTSYIKHKQEVEFLAPTEMDYLIIQDIIEAKIPEEIERLNNAWNKGLIEINGVKIQIKFTPSVENETFGPEGFYYRFHMALQIVDSSKYVALFGRQIENEEDYIEFVNMLKIKAGQRIEDNIKGIKKKGRKPLDPVTKQKRKELKEKNSSAYKRYIEACRQRKNNISDAWAEYKKACAEKKKIVKELNNKIDDTLIKYNQVKYSPPPKIEDFK